MSYIGSKGGLLDLVEDMSMSSNLSLVASA